MNPFPSTAFTGGVFSDRIEGGRASATLEPTFSGIAARSSTGEEFFLEYRDCVLELGGASGRMLFCRTEDRKLTFFSEDPGFSKALEREARGMLGEKLEELFRRSRKERRRGFMWGLIIVGVICGLLIAGYYGVIAAARSAVAALPRSVDESIGELAIESMDLEGGPVKDNEVVKSVEAIVNQIAPHCGAPEIRFQVRVIQSSTENAFALPGGYIVVYTGLIKKAKSAEQLAGVIAHEISHVVERHGLQRIGSSIGIEMAFQLLVGDARGLARFGSEVLQASATNSYSREQETEADLAGVRMLHAAGINPVGMPEFFELMRDEDGDLPGVISWISTHPQHSERAEAIRRKLEELPPREYSPLPIDWADIQSKIP